MVAAEEASSENTFANPYSACGFVGGIIFCVSLLPQLFKTYRTKSAKDLSYFWQACYLLGLISISIYGVAYKLWPVAIPLIIEIGFMVTLTVLKIRYDKRAKKLAAAGVDADAADSGGAADADGATDAADVTAGVDGGGITNKNSGTADENSGPYDTAGTSSVIPAASNGDVEIAPVQHRAVSSHAALEVGSSVDTSR